MKKLEIFSIIVILLVSISAKAQNVITVSNNPNSPGQYSELQPAIDDASDGDTLYVSGSNISYGNVTIDKQLTLIGSGYHPDNQYQMVSSLGNVVLTSASNTSANGTCLSGFNTGTIENDVEITDVILSRNAILGFHGSTNQWISSICFSKKASNWIIHNNIIYGRIFDNVDTSQNILFSNNVFNLVQFNIGNHIFNSFLSSSIIIKNNLFMTKENQYAFYNCYYIQVVNNIFFDVRTDYVNFGTFQNNISYSGDFTLFDYGNNTAIGNLVDTDPEFVNAPSFNFDYSYDYHLQTSSPGVGAGSDGTDIGIYGGTYPFPSGGDVPYQTSPMPSIPQIIEVNVQTPVIISGDTLKVNVKARIQD